MKLSDKSGLTILRIALGADMVIDALTKGAHLSLLLEIEYIFIFYCTPNEDGVATINAEAIQKIEDDDLFVVSKIAEIAQNWGTVSTYLIPLCHDIPLYCGRSHCRDILLSRVSAVQTRSCYLKWFESIRSWLLPAA